MPGRLTAFNDAIGKSWEQMTSRKSDQRRKDGTDWSWRPASPRDLPRAEVCRTEIEAPLARQLFPEFFPEVVPASAADSEAPLRVVRAGSIPVQNCAQLHEAAQAALDSGQPVECTFEAPDGSTSTKNPSLKLDPVELAGLEQIVHSAQPVTRVTTEDRHWVVIRDQNVRCRVSTFVEPSRGIVHLILGISTVWGEGQLLPKEIEMTCGDEPLRCLSVAGTLELLYGDARQLLHPPAPRDRSFKQVSDSEDFLTPYNYEELQHRWEREHTPSLSQQHTPALANVPGEAYPGSPVLADARALATLCWQPQLIHPDGTERLGWVMFAGRNVSRGQPMLLKIDLGSGPRQILLSAPR
jgi:hypothetical protein